MLFSSSFQARVQGSSSKLPPPSPSSPAPPPPTSGGGGRLTPKSSLGSKRCDMVLNLLNPIFWLFFFKKKSKKKISWFWKWLLALCWNVRARAGGSAEEKIIVHFSGCFRGKIVGNWAARNCDGKYGTFLFQESVRRAPRLLPQLHAHHGRDQRRGDEEEVQELGDLTGNKNEDKERPFQDPHPLGNMCVQSLVRKNKEVAFMVRNDACFVFYSAATAVRSGNGQSCCCCWRIFQSGA